MSSAKASIVSVRFDTCKAHFVTQTANCLVFCALCCGHVQTSQQVQASDWLVVFSAHRAPGLMLCGLYVRVPLNILMPVLALQMNWLSLWLGALEARGALSPLSWAG